MKKILLVFLTAALMLSCCAPASAAELPAGLTEIGDEAFMNTRLISPVTIPDGVKTIGRRAFYGCFRLSAIRLPKDCDIHDEAFKGCNTVYVFAPAGGSTEAYCAAHENCVFVKE